MTTSEDAPTNSNTENDSVMAEASSAPLLKGLPPGRLSASRLGLAKACPGSFTVGHVQNNSEPGSPADKGTKIHAFLEKLILTGIREPHKIADPDARKICEELDPLHVMNVIRGHSGDLESRYADENFIAGPAEILAESAFALSEDGLEARILPKTEEHRDYSQAPAEPGWTCGTADAVVVGKTYGSDRETAVVTDWKTGVLQGNPEKSLQLRFLALAVARVYGLSRVIAQFAYLGPGGQIHTSEFEFGPEDLEKISAEMRELVSATRNPQAPFVTGGHCRYCPAFSACPAQAGAAQAILEGATSEIEELDPETAALVWDRLQAVEAATKKVRKALQDYLANRGEGIPLPAGTELRVATSRRDTILAGVAMPILREHFGEAADKAVTVTKKGLKAVADGNEDQILSEIEEYEGIKTTYSESLREHGTTR